MESKERKNYEKKDDLPEKFKNIEETANFWNTHSLADYKDLQKDIEFEVELKSEKNYFTIEKELSDIDKLSHAKGVLPEALVNLWIKEKVHENQL